MPANGEAGVTNLVSGAPVRTFVRYGGAGNTGNLQATAVDKDAAAGFDTINLRAQAQTQQVEIFGTNGLTFALGLQAGATITQDTDGDTLADWWETQYGFDPASAVGVNGANGDIDGDGLTNAQEFAFGTNPLVNDAPSTQLRITKPVANQRRLSFQTRPDRAYRIYFTNDLLTPFTAVVPDLPGTGAEQEWIDDGTQTGTAPNAETDRFYKVQARLPQPE